MRSMFSNVFSSALSNSARVDDKFYEFDAGLLGLGPDQVRAHQDQIIPKIRELIQRHAPEGMRLWGFDYIPEEAQREAARLVAEHQIAAIDGTVAMEEIAMAHVTAMVVAVGHASGRESSSSQLTLTSTVGRQLDPGTIETAEDLDGLLEALSTTYQDQSWPTTFREYKEREYASALPYPVRILDGPIVTQNLITQPAGRDLLQSIVMDDCVYIGVIKEVNRATPLTRLGSFIVRQGEVFSFSYGDEVEARYEHDREGVQKWARHYMDDFVRAVYCLHAKPFAVECKRKHLDLALAIVQATHSDTLNQETPFYLNMIDRELRNKFNASANRRRVLASVARQDVALAIRMDSEREYRT